MTLQEALNGAGMRERLCLTLLLIFEASRLAGSERSVKRLEVDSVTLRCRFGSGLYIVFSFL